MSTITHDAPTEARPRSGEAALVRFLPLAGLAYGGLQITGNLVIDKFPDETTSTGAVVHYYATHHAQVQRGGELLAWGCLFLGLFVAGLVVRSRRSPATAALIGVGGAAMLAAEIASASTYALLGSIGTETHLDPAALQAWHVAGAAFGIGIATTMFLLGVAAAGVLTHALPSWVGWTALVLGLASLTSFGGFLASLLVLPWAAAVGIALALRPQA